jgi:hypothetical protein
MLESTPGNKVVTGIMASEFKQSFGSDDQEVGHMLRDVIGLFKRIRPTMPAQYIDTFLMVASEEGLGVTEYAERAGVSRSVMTRHLLDIGERNRHKEEGFGLVVQKADVMDLRKHRAFLSDEGRALYRAILRATRNVRK